MNGFSTFYYSESNGSPFDKIKPYIHMINIVENNVTKETPEVDYANIACQIIGKSLLFTIGMGVKFTNIIPSNRISIPNDKQITINIDFKSLMQMLHISYESIHSAAGRVPVAIDIDVTTESNDNNSWDVPLVSGHAIYDWSYKCISIFITDLYTNIIPVARNKILHMGVSFIFIVRLS